VVYTIIWKEKGSLRKCTETTRIERSSLTRAFKRFFPDEYKRIVKEHYQHLNDSLRKQKNLRQGYNFENRIRNYYEEQGYFVVRSDRSKGPADLVAIKKNGGKTEILLIQCKVDKSHFCNSEKKKLKVIARKIGAIPLLIYRGQPPKFRILKRKV
jgi:Holliday junction resolvase